VVTIVYGIVLEATDPKVAAPGESEAAVIFGPWRFPYAPYQTGIRVETINNVGGGVA
jgi:hypothetical protein